MSLSSFPAPLAEETVFIPLDILSCFVKDELATSHLGWSRKDYVMEKKKKKDSLPNEGYWENWTRTCRRIKPSHFLIPYTKINSKWGKDLNVRQETIKILEENSGSNFFDIGHRNFLLDMSQKAKETIANISNWGLIKIKSSAQLKKQSTTLKVNLQNWKRYLQMTYLIKPYYPKSTDNISNSAPKIQIIQWRNGQKTWLTLFQRKHPDG